LSLALDKCLNEQKRCQVEFTKADDWKAECERRTKIYANAIAEAQQALDKFVAVHTAEIKRAENRAAIDVNEAQ
jgi:hypothetical protein